MKTWKIAQLIGVLMLLAGVVIRVNGEIYGVHLAMLGLLIYVVAKVTLWIKSDKA